MTSEGGEGPKTNAAAGPGQPPTTLTGQHRALDEAAAQLVAAWDVAIDSHTPAEGQDALERLRPPATTPSFPPTSRTPSTPLPAAIAPRGTSSSKWPWFAAGAAVLVGVGLLVTSGRDTPMVTPAAQPPAAAVTASAPEVVPAAAPATTPTPTPVVEAMPARHRLTIRTIPKDAALTIAGQRVDNPYRGKHAGGDTLQIEATARGHQQAVRELELTEDTDLMVTLVPEEPQAKAPRASAQKRRASAAKKARRKAQARQKAKARDRRSKARRKPRTPKQPSGGSAGFVSSNPYE